MMYRYDTGMKSVHIKSVNDATLDRLKRLARCHHRSLQGELHAILERAARLAPPEDDDEELPLTTVDIGGDATWRRGEIYDADGR